MVAFLKMELAKGRHTRPVEGYDSLVSSSGSSKLTHIMSLLQEAAHPKSPAVSIRTDCRDLLARA